MRKFGRREEEIQKLIKNASINFFLGDEDATKKILRKALKKLQK